MGVSRDQLIDYLVANFGVRAEALDADVPLFSQGLLDSFHLIDLVGYLEREAGIEIGATEVNIDDLDSVSRILAFVKSKSGA